MYRCEKCNHFLIWEYPQGWYCPICGPTIIYCSNHTEKGDSNYEITNRTN